MTAVFGARVCVCAPQSTQCDVSVAWYKGTRVFSCVSHSLSGLLYCWAANICCRSHLVPPGSGSSVGDPSGHIKQVNSCDIKQNRLVVFSSFTRTLHRVQDWCTRVCVCVCMFPFYTFRVCSTSQKYATQYLLCGPTGLTALCLRVKTATVAFSQDLRST